MEARSRRVTCLRRARRRHPAARRSCRRDGTVTWGEFRFTRRRRAERSGSGGAAAIAASGPLVVRRWRAGDRLAPSGAQGARRVKRYLSEAGVRGRDRGGWPVVVEQGGRSSGFQECAAATRQPRGPEDRYDTTSVSAHRLIRASRDGRCDRVVYDAPQIARRVRGARRGDHRGVSGRGPARAGLLKGSFIFLSDLVREINRPLHVDFLVASSYGDGTVSSGNVRLVYDPETELEGKHILLVEDIVDTGRTLNRLMDLLTGTEPAFARDLRPAAQAHRRRAEVRNEVRRIRRTARVSGRIRAGSRRELSAHPIHREPAVDASANVAEERQQEQPTRDSTGGASRRRSRSGSSSC